MQNPCNMITSEKTKFFHFRQARPFFAGIEIIESKQKIIK